MAKNTKKQNAAAVVNRNFMAFYVDDDELEETAELIVSSLIAQCLMDFGTTPRELE